MEINFINKITNNIIKKKNIFLDNLLSLIKTKNNNDYDESLTELLIKADVSLELTEKMIKILKKNNEKNDIKKSLGIIMDNILHKCEKKLNPKLYKPFVILIVGLNGVGKTTTVAKIANLYKKIGMKVLVAAGDTYRAAGIQQLDVICKKYNIPILDSKHTDSAAIIFNAFKLASAENYDVLIADTAGRLHTNHKLMSNLIKIDNVLKKIDVKAPHEIMMIIDATFGQNAIIQVKTFNKYINITGLSISKLDGTAKAGTILSIADTLNIPIRYIGNGEKIDDINHFKSKDYINNLLEINL